MKSLIFWKEWSKPERGLLLLSGLVLFTCLSIYFYRFYLGVNGAIEWETGTEVERVEQTLSTFERFGESYEIKGSDFVSRSFFKASAIQLNAMHTKLFFGFVTFSLILILTGISFIKKMAGFAAAMTAVGAGMYFFSFDLLECFGRQDNLMLSIGFVLFIGVTASFNILNENKTKLMFRLAAIALVVLGFFTLVILNAQVELPIYYLTNYSAKSLSVVVIVFSALVGYDIIAWFFYIITASKSFSTSNTLTNFLVITVLYLASLLIFFLHQINYISWNLTLFNPFILLAISTVVGFWGQHKRRELFLDLLNYRKGGVWIYMGMAIMAISSVAYAFQTSNTAMIASFEEGIVYTHLTMGGAFVIYVMKNFRVPILQGIPVWKKLYFPSRLTHRFTRFIGVATVVLLIMVGKNVPIRKWKAGITNYKADVYQQEGAYLLAEQNYLAAYAYYPKNFKAHYTLAMMAMERGELDKTIQLFEDMVRFRAPNQFALVNFAQAYAQNGDVYNAYFTIKKALTTYPNEGHLQHNLAYHAEKNKDLEEVYLNYLLAQQNLTSEELHLPYQNILAFAKNFEKGKLVDSLLNYTKYDSDFSIAANKFALANLNKKTLAIEPLLIEDSIIGLSKTSYLINRLNNDLNDKELRQKAKGLINSNPENRDLLTYSLAVNATRRQEYMTSDSLLKQTVVVANADLEPYYYFEAGKNYLAFGDLVRAELCFKTSYQKQPFQPANDAGIYLAEVQLAQGKAKEGVELLQELTQFEPTKERANHLLYALSFTEAAQLDSLPKAVMTDLANFNPWFFHSEMLEHILASGKLDEPVALASFRRAIAEQKFTEADMIWTAVQNLDEFAKSPFVKLRLEQLESQSRAKELVSLAGTNQLRAFDTIYTNYFNALVAVRLGDLTSAEKNFKLAVNEIPFYEPLGLSVVNFYSQVKKDDKAAYDVLIKLLDFHELSLTYNLMYVHLALTQGEFFFADQTVKDIGMLGLMSSEKFAEYEEIYEAKRAHAIEKWEDEW